MAKASDPFREAIAGVAVNLPFDDHSHMRRMADLESHALKIQRQKVDRERTIANAADQAAHAASHTVHVIDGQMSDFEERLRENEEIALYVIGGPAGGSFFPTSIEAVDPDKVIFTGLDPDNRPFLVVQHVSQLNFAMRAAVITADEKPRRLGFHHPLGDD